MKNSLREKNIERLLKGASSIIIATDNGIGVDGKLPMVLSNLAMLIHQISANGCPREILEHSINLGLGRIEDKKESKKEKDDFDEMVKDVLSMVRDDINKMLGDDENE